MSKCERYKVKIYIKDIGVSKETWRENSTKMRKMGETCKETHKGVNYKSYKNGITRGKQRLRDSHLTVRRANQKRE